MCDVLVTNLRLTCRDGKLKEIYIDDSVYRQVYIDMSNISRETGTYIDIFDISEEIYRLIIFS